MPQPKEHRSFLKRILKNVANIDKSTLLKNLTDESDINENWQRIFDRVEEGILICSPDGVADFFNPAAEKLLGMKAATTSSSAFWEELTDTDLKHFFKTHFQSDATETSQTFRILNPREKNIRVHVFPHAVQHPDRHLVILLDLTNPLLPEVERMARGRFEALVRLAGGLAHEIGNPLNAMTLHAEILKKQIQKLDSHQQDKLADTLQIIRDEIKHLDRIVRNFLKTTRRPPLRFQMKNLCAIAVDVMRVMRPSMEEHAIQLDFQHPEHVDFFLDEERIRSMLLNLIQNALESMPNGGTLRVAVSLQANTAKIEIQDTGSGINKNDLPHIFEAYFTTKEHGSGLGLLFVYDTVSDHGGKIQVHSEKGKGTAFEILLPLRRPNLQINHSSQK